jgi:hypothetical protein
MLLPAFAGSKHRRQAKLYEFSVFACGFVTTTTPGAVAPAKVTSFGGVLIGQCVLR